MMPLCSRAIEPAQHLPAYYLLVSPLATRKAC